MKKLKIIIMVVLAVLVCGVGGFFLWASDYYKAETSAIAIMDKDATMEEKDNIIVLPGKTATDTGLIFYPGAKVEAKAYLPILDKIRTKCGITCILVEMPLRMAIFNPDAAQDIWDSFPDITNWYIGGHSMGGAMASDFASKHQEDVKGLVLLGAYIYGDYPPSKALTVYGTFNSNLEKDINYTDNVIVIEGGNHAQFGNYGKQKGDPDATISSEEQQNITVEAIAEFITKTSVQ